MNISSAGYFNSSTGKNQLKWFVDTSFDENTIFNKISFHYFNEYVELFSLNYEIEHYISLLNSVARNEEELFYGLTDFTKILLFYTNSNNNQTYLKDYTFIQETFQNYLNFMDFDCMRLICLFQEMADMFNNKNDFLTNENYEITQQIATLTPK